VLDIIEWTCTIPLQHVSSVLTRCNITYCFFYSAVLLFLSFRFIFYFYLFLYFCVCFISSHIICGEWHGPFAVRFVDGPSRFTFTHVSKNWPAKACVQPLALAAKGSIRRTVGPYFHTHAIFGQANREI